MDIVELLLLASRHIALTKRSNSGCTGIAKCPDCIWATVVRNWSTSVRGGPTNGSTGSTIVVYSCSVPKVHSISPALSIVWRIRVLNTNA